MDYFYGFMAPSTGMLKYFDIVPYESGFVLLFPGAHSRSVEPLVTSNKLFHTLDDSREWSKMLGIGTIGSLNDAIAAGRGQEIMLLQEALMEQKIVLHHQARHRLPTDCQSSLSQRAESHIR